MKKNNIGPRYFSKVIKNVYSDMYAFNKNEKLPAYLKLKKNMF